MTRGALGITALAAIVSTVAAMFACTGGDPDIDAPVDAGGGGQDAIGSNGESSTSSSNDASGDAPVTTDPLCPGTRLPCGAAPAGYGAPVFHLDACTLGNKEGRIDTWTARTGPSVTRPPAGSGAIANGGLFCLGGFNGRPGVRFVYKNLDGFYLSAQDAVALDYLSEFTLVAVMSYVQSSADVPGSIVFQRANTAYPFGGPTLTANHAYEQPSGGLALVPSKNLGVQLQFGPKGDGGVSAVSTVPHDGARVVVAYRRGTSLVLRANQTAYTETIPGGVNAKGEGRPLHIGFTGQLENSFEGSIGELIFYASDIGDSAISALETQLAAKWGISF
jgi:hypothetical protein